MQNFEQSFQEILRHEGGFVNHPRDPGGITNLGCTKATYEDWVGHKVSEEFMRKLQPSHVQALYKVKYWDAVRAGDLPRGLDLCVFDFGINAGPQRAKRYLQMMVGAKPDGLIGPATLAAVNNYIRRHSLEMAIDRYQDLRIEYYRKLRTFATFGRGWLRRVADIRQKAKEISR